MTNFDTGHAYMTMDQLGTTFVHVDFDFGILPIPKYDVEQESYNHLNWGNNLVIPTTVRDTEMVGSVIELMNYYTSTGVYDAYYDTVLEYRVSDTTDDREMIKLICNTVVYDPAMPFCDSRVNLKKLIYLAAFAPSAGKDSITSYVMSNGRPAKNFLKKLFKDS